MLISGGTIRLTRQCSGALAEAGITVAPITDRSKLVRPRSSPHAMAGFPAGTGAAQSRNCTPPAPWPQSVTAQSTESAERKSNRIPASLLPKLLLEFHHDGTLAASGEQFLMRPVARIKPDESE